MWLSAVGCIVTLTLSLLAAPLAAESQLAAKVPRVGVLIAGTSRPGPSSEAFRQGLRDLGYVEGQTIILEERWAEGQLERFPDLAAKLVQLQVQVIVAGNVPAARAASQATGHIPIVLAGGDAMGTGLIPNIARPDGNITGLATNAAELSGKWLELLKEAVPAVSRVAVLSFAESPFIGPAWREMQGAAPALGVQLQALSVHEPSDLEGAFASSLLNMHRARVIELAARSRLLTMWEQ